MQTWRNPNVMSFDRSVADFKAGRDTPRDFLERCLDVIERRDKTVQAFVIVNKDGARQAADAATLRYRSGAPLSPVDGCPVAIKDIIATADMPTQMKLAQTGFVTHCTTIRRWPQRRSLSLRAQTCRHHARPDRGRCATG